MIVLSDIAKHIGDRILFEGVSANIGVGERIGLVGANGSGKTTLLEILAGNLEPDQGDVHRNKRATVGYLKQEVPKESSQPLLAAILAGHGELDAIQHKLALLTEEMESTADPAELEALAHRHGALEERFAAGGGYDLPARAKKILAGLGFNVADFERPTHVFSGGWLMRLGLGRLLLAEPDLLLLDEPTNYLDLSSVVWLEGYLAAYEGSMIIVSHDRVLLNELSTRIFELDARHITSYTGNYDDFLHARAVREEGLEAQRKAQSREIAKTERFIERFRYKNTKAKQVQSRIKRLDKMERVETSAHRRSMRFQFPEPGRSSRVQLELDDVWKSYDGPPVYSGIDMRVEQGDRIALVGPNGAGKSTLLKVLAGTIDIDRGERRLGHNVVVAYYAQHQIEALDYGRTILDEMRIGAPHLLDERLRTIMGAFLFTGDDVQKKIGVLSGGEKARVALAKMLITAPNVLLLDEPTSHLDIPARDVLEEALDSYRGSLVMISHDRHFIDSLTNRVVEAGGGALRTYLGNFSDYQERREREAGGAQEAAATASPLDPQAETTSRTTVARGKRSKEDKRRAAQIRQERSRKLGPLKKQVAELEHDIDELTRNASALEQRMANSAFYESAGFDEALRDHKETLRVIELKTAQWESQQLELESLEAELEASD